jgi:hypothetical protein
MVAFVISAAPGWARRSWYQASCTWCGSEPSRYLIAAFICDETEQMCDWRGQKKRMGTINQAALSASGVRQTREMKERLRPQLCEPDNEGRRLYDLCLQPTCSIYERTIHASPAPHSSIKRYGGPCQQTLVDYCRCGGYASRAIRVNASKTHQASPVSIATVKWFDSPHVRRRVKEQSA